MISPRNKSRCFLFGAIICEAIATKHSKQPSSIQYFLFDLFVASNLLVILSSRE